MYVLEQFFKFLVLHNSACGQIREVRTTAWGFCHDISIPVSAAMFEKHLMMN